MVEHVETSAPEASRKMIKAIHCRRKVPQQSRWIDKVHRIISAVGIRIEALRISDAALHRIRTGPSARSALILPPPGVIQSGRVAFEHRILLTISIRNVVALTSCAHANA